MSAFPATPPPQQPGALCAETDPELFFPDPGYSPKPAKAICAKCELQEACAEWAIVNHPQSGVWGGTTERQRAAEVRIRNTTREEEAA